MRTININTLDMDRQVFWQKNYLHSSKANTLLTVGLTSTLLF